MTSYFVQILVCKVLLGRFCSNEIIICFSFPANWFEKSNGIFVVPILLVIIYGRDLAFKGGH